MERVHINNGIDKTPYELWYGHVPTLKYFRIFRSKYHIKRDYCFIKFDPISDEGIFLGYSTKRKSFKCYNRLLKKIVESANIKVDEIYHIRGISCSYKLDDEEENHIVVVQNHNGLVEQNEESGDSEINT